jgi:hypothetical protein
MTRLPQKEVDRLIQETGPVLDKYTSAVGDIDGDTIIEAERQPERNAEEMNSAIRRQFGLEPEAQESEDNSEEESGEEE